MTDKAYRRNLPANRRDSDLSLPPRVLSGCLQLSPRREVSQGITHTPSLSLYYCTHSQPSLCSCGEHLTQSKTVCSSSFLVLLFALALSLSLSLPSPPSFSSIHKSHSLTILSRHLLLVRKGTSQSRPTERERFYALSLLSRTSNASWRPFITARARYFQHFIHQGLPLPEETISAPRKSIARF